jgi:hypothetical protein
MQRLSFLLSFRRVFATEYNDEEERLKAFEGNQNKELVVRAVS